MSHLGTKMPFFSKIVYQYPSLKPLFAIRYSIPVSLLMTAYLITNMQGYYNPDVKLSKIEKSDVISYPDYANYKVSFYRLRDYKYE